MIHILPLLSWFKRPKQKNKQTVTYTNYANDIKQHIDGMRLGLKNHLRPMHKNQAYIIHSKAELNAFFDLLRIIKGSPYAHQLTETFETYKMQYKTHSIPFDGVFFLWENNFSPIAISNTDQDNIANATTSQTRIFDMATIHDNPICHALIDINTLYDHVNDVLAHKKDPTFVNKLSENQAFVDYIIKLNAIAADDAVLERLLQRDPAWIQTFFKPLRTINTQLGLKVSAEEQKRQKRADDKLDTIVNWSSTTVHPVQKPVNKTIMPYQPLLDERMLDVSKK